MSRLVERALGETDREGLHLAAELGHHRRDCARVDAAREEHAQRHVADELLAHGFPKHRAQRRALVVQVALALAVGGVDVQLGRPVAPNDRRPRVERPRQRMARAQLADTADDAARRRHELVGQVFVEGNRVDALAQRPVPQQRFQFGREDQALPVDRVMERLDADPVPREEQNGTPAVQHGKGEHAVEAIDHVLAPLLVAVDEHLGIGLRDERVSRRDQLLAQLAMVIDLPVLDDPDRRVFVVHRLMTAGEVDDRKPAHAEGDAVELLDTRIVRPSMDHRVAHSRHEVEPGGRFATSHSTDPTH